MKNDSANEKRVKKADPKEENKQPSPKKRSIPKILHINGLPRMSKDGEPTEELQLVVPVDNAEMLDPEMAAAVTKMMKQITKSPPLTKKQLEIVQSHQLLKRDMGTLEAISTEYLKSFMILGYTMDGEKISIFHATSPQEHDSIIEHARGTLMSILIKSQQNLPGM